MIKRKSDIQESTHPETTFVLLVELFQLADFQTKRAILNHPNVLPTNEDGTLNASLLAELAQEFPEEVARHPLFVLHALVEPDEEMEGVVREVVQRTADVGLIEQVLRSWGPDSWGVRRSVAKNPTTPLNVLRTLGNEVTESDWYVRKAVTSNPNTPPDVLRTMGNPKTESNWEVRDAAQKALEARGLP